MSPTLKGEEPYLGSDQTSWKNYDATELIMAGKTHSQTILIDQGSKDDFLEKELLTNHITRAAEGKSVKLKVRMQEGYDHSYYFISTFIEDHIKHLR